MSDENQEVLEDDSEDLQEFKASHGDPSEVADPVTKGSTMRHADKEGGEKTPVVTKGSTPPKTKVGMINAMMTKMHSMKKEDLHSAYSKMMEDLESDEDLEISEEEVSETGDGKNRRVSGNAAVTGNARVSGRPRVSGDGKNRRRRVSGNAAVTGNARVSGRPWVSGDAITVTKEDIDIEDDVKALFGMDDLSEDFKAKATTIFETAVLTKINEKLADISEEVEAEALLESHKNHEEMVEKLDSYLDYVVEQWQDENRLALESGIRTEITEEFMGGLKNLFEESYIDIPEEKVDVVSELSEKSDKLEEQLDIELQKNVELNEKIEKLIRGQIVFEISEDLTEVQTEKFEGLASNVEFVTEEDFREKLDMIKESYFTDEDKIESVIDEEEPLEESTEVPTRGDMAAYMASISRTVKK
jgi:hypothetical protein